MRSGVTMLLVEENFSHVQGLDAHVLLLEAGRRAAGHGGRAPGGRGRDGDLHGDRGR